MPYYRRNWADREAWGPYEGHYAEGPYTTDPYGRPIYRPATWNGPYRPAGYPAAQGYGPGYPQGYGQPGVYEIEEVFTTPSDYGNPKYRLTDEQLRNRVYDSLDHDYRIPSTADIIVTVLDGIATLTGTVRNRYLKELIGRHAWAQPGIVDVHNNITLNPRWLERRVVQTPTGETAVEVVETEVVPTHPSRPRGIRI